MEFKRHQDPRAALEIGLFQEALDTMEDRIDHYHEMIEEQNEEDEQYAIEENKEFTPLLPDSDSCWDMILLYWELERKYELQDEHVDKFDEEWYD